MTCTGEEVLIHTRYFEMGAKDNSEERENRSSDIEKDVKQENGESDYEPARDSLSSQSNEDNKIKRTSRVPKKLSRKESTENFTRPTSSSSNRLHSSKPQLKTPNNSLNKSQKSIRASSAPKVLRNGISSGDVKVPPKPPSELSEESDDKTSEDVKEIDVLDEAPICDQSAGTDDDVEENNMGDDGVNAYQKIDEMKQRIEKLEEELREVAALEISLYSMVPEHGSSAHKVHTPARRLSRLYIHACKHWTRDKRATVAKNTVSGLVLIAKSCGNDVSRLTFWLSNTVVLREIISQTFGNLSHQNSVVRSIELNGSGNRSEGEYSPEKWENNSGGGRQMKRPSFDVPQIDDWQETSTFVAALEKIEAWIFSRTVESVWWQTLTPHMQSPVETDLYSERRFGNFSINLWNSAFHDTFTRLCPVRSGGHECGCLPILTRMVMEQCVSRLDVAMFNAILRESANELPTDPVSDPILDPKVLPIPAGYLSFGSGAQLKNSIGNWSRSLTDLFGMDSEETAKSGSKSFGLLNELSDLLMLPKDMLTERDIRKEVCPSIGLPLITRILCNFTPDEFCPDYVPGVVLEELNTESLLELRGPGSFPLSACPVAYFAMSAADVAEKVSDAGVRRKGYTSDEDLYDLDSPLTSIISKTGEDGTLKDGTYANARYELLREVWPE